MNSFSKQSRNSEFSYGLPEKACLIFTESTCGMGNFYSHLNQMAIKNQCWILHLHLRNQQFRPEGSKGLQISPSVPMFPKVMEAGPISYKPQYLRDIESERVLKFS